MGTSVQELKHAAKLQEWSIRIAECRGSGIGVKAWCLENGVSLKTYYNWERQIVKEATQQYVQSNSVQSGSLMRIIPEKLSAEGQNNIGSCITIRHGESTITLPAASSTDAVANLVKALNCDV